MVYLLKIGIFHESNANCGPKGHGQFDPKDARHEGAEQHQDPRKVNDYRDGRYKNYLYRHVDMLINNINIINIIYIYHIYHIYIHMYIHHVFGLTEITRINAV